LKSTTNFEEVEEINEIRVIEIIPEDASIP